MRATRRTAIPFVLVFGAVVLIVGGSLGSLFAASGAISSPRSSLSAEGRIPQLATDKVGVSHGSGIVPIAFNPHDDWAAMTTDGHYVYVSTLSGQIQKINPTTGAVIASVQLTNGGVLNLVSDGSFVYAGTTAPASVWAVYKLDTHLKVLFEVVDPNGEGISTILVPAPGGDVYFGDGGSNVYEYNPTLTTLLASTAVGFGSVTDSARVGNQLWWLDRFGGVLVTGPSLQTIAAASLPVSTGDAKGFVVRGGVVFTGDGTGGFWRLNLSGSSLTFAQVLSLPEGPVALVKGPLFLGSSLYLPIKTTPATVLVYSYPDFALKRSVTAPDGNPFGVGNSHQFDEADGRAVLLTNSTIYMLSRS